MTKEPLESRWYTFLSWNMCLFEISAQAPSDWRIDLTEALVRETIIRHNPDFVFFQELPGMVPFVETHDLVPVNTISHSGNIATIVRKDLAAKLKSRPLGSFAIAHEIDGSDLTFANVHLEPGKDGDYKRLQMLNTIKHHCETHGLVIVGDTNMRVKEEEQMEPIGLYGERPPTQTWNTHINQFRSDGRAFSAYFTRYFHTKGTIIDQVHVLDEPYTLNEKEFYISDHFALFGRAKFSKGSSKSSK